jgi:hypothetical protein
MTRSPDDFTRMKFHVEIAAITRRLATTNVSSIAEKLEFFDMKVL